MDLLLDTHAVIWFFNGDEQLSERAKTEILNPHHLKYVSLASIWEVAIKISINKLIFKGGVAGFIQLIRINEFQIIPITENHIIHVESLDFIHRDPFDRIIISTAMVEKMSIITRDDNIQKYNIPCIW